MENLIESIAESNQGLNEKRFFPKCKYFPMKSNPWVKLFKKGGETPQKDRNKFFCNYEILTNDLI